MRSLRLRNTPGLSPAARRRQSFEHQRDRRPGSRPRAARSTRIWTSLCSTNKPAPQRGSIIASASFLANLLKIRHSNVRTQGQAGSGGLENRVVSFFAKELKVRRCQHSGRIGSTKEGEANYKRPRTVSAICMVRPADRSPGCHQPLRCDVSISTALRLPRLQHFPGRRLPNRSSGVTGFWAACRPLYLWTRPRLETGRKTHLMSDADARLFQQGTHCRLQEKLGAHPVVVNGVSRVQFAVWPPNAERLSVIGDFNQWDLHEQSAAGAVASAEFGKASSPPPSPACATSISSNRATRATARRSPTRYAFHAELPPKSASIIWDLDYTWGDIAW